MILISSCLPWVWGGKWGGGALLIPLRRSSPCETSDRLIDPSSLAPDFGTTSAPPTGARVVPFIFRVSLPLASGEARDPTELSTGGARFTGAFNCPRSRRLWIASAGTPDAPSVRCVNNRDHHTDFPHWLRPPAAVCSLLANWLTLRY